MKDPQTAAEWQLAVDCATALRAISDCKAYGLIYGGPPIDVARCDEILDRGRKRGVRPSKPDHELAIEMVQQLNAQAAAQKKGA